MKVRKKFFFCLFVCLQFRLKCIDGYTVNKGFPNISAVEKSLKNVTQAIITIQ